MKQKSSTSIHREHYVQQVRINDQNIYVRTNESYNCKGDWMLAAAWLNVSV